MTSHPHTSEYQIVGVDTRSHDDVVITIEALSEANARAKAELRGVLVTEVERLPSRESLDKAAEMLEAAFAEELENALAEGIDSAVKAQRDQV